MLKLYKSSDEGFSYWETWDLSDTHGIIHQGEVGSTGKQKEIVAKTAEELEKKIQKEIIKKIDHGYAEIEEEDMTLLEVQFTIKNNGTAADITMRNDLDDLLSELLGWTGLGHVDGGSMGNGSMEISCAVVDFDTARRVIAEELKGTAFASYSAIVRVES